MQMLIDGFILFAMVLSDHWFMSGTKYASRVELCGTPQLWLKLLISQFLYVLLYAEIVILDGQKVIIYIPKR